MSVAVLSGASANLPVGGTWEMVLHIADTWGVAADEEPVITVTLPGGGTAVPDVESRYAGCYRAVYLPAAAGRYTARAVTATLGSADLTAYVTAAVTAADFPTIADVDTYLGNHSFTNDELQDILDAEASAQRDVCTVPAAYPDSLRQALLRRCAVNAAKRALPLAMVRGDSETGSTAYVPGRDPEVRRFEGPHRRMIVG